MLGRSMPLIQLPRPICALLLDTLNTGVLALNPWLHQTGVSHDQDRRTSDKPKERR